MAGEVQSQSVYDKVVSLINEANASKDPASKVGKLTAVKDLVLHEDPALLDNFLDEVITFQSDALPEVRILVLTFIAEACKKDNEFISKLIVNMGFMMNDDDINVQKKVIAVMAQLYPVALKWLTKTRSVTSVMEQTWDFIVQLKAKIIPMTDADNDGIRTHAIKFVEQCAVAQSCRSANSESIPSAPMSLDQMPRDHRLISYRRLEADGKSLFQKLLGLLGSQHISSVNLMVCMGSLTLIALQRPEFMERVILAFDSLHVNLPPTLAKSQVTSVRKNLKLHLLSLLKHPASVEYQPQMIMLLTDLGAKPAEVNKILPPGTDLRQQQSRSSTKRGASLGLYDENSNDEFGGASSSTTSKKPRLDEDEEDDDDEVPSKSGPAVISESDTAEKQRQQAIETTANFLYGKLSNPGSVVDLVLVSLVVIPEAMPAHFQASYTPIAAAGTEAQIRHLSRLMATQLTAKGFGPGAEQLKALEAKRLTVKMEQSGMTPSITMATSSKSEKPTTPAVPIIPVGVQPPAQNTRRLHKFGLAHITKPMDTNALMRMMSQAWERIMAAEKRVVNGGATTAHAKILVRMASTFNIPDFNNALVSYILDDAKSRADVAILWVYQEYQDYCTFSGFTHTFLKDREEGAEKYDACLCRLLSTLFDRGEQKESLFHKILLEAPAITVNALHILMRACMDQAHGSLGLTTLKEMTLTRPTQRDTLLRVLLDFTSYERSELRHRSLEIAKELYVNEAVRENVKEHVKTFLNNLRKESPPGSLFGEMCGRTENPGKWTEDSIRASLYLYLYLLPVDHALIHDLAAVYVAAISDVKRVILKLLEGPIKAVGIHSPELLTLVERCPAGAETLITLIVRLLTERSIPTPELVKRVQDLYPRRVSDVRFLIPVLTGLNKKEVLSVLPELIKLRPDVVRQVFNILYPKGNPENRQHALRPSELMIALHQIDVSNEDVLKHVISAIDILLNDRKDLYRKDTLPGVIQHLIEQQPLPILFMRTLIKVFKAYEHSLAGFVLNMLQRLIIKQVWKHPQAWQGFVRCCVIASSRTCPLLVNLPAPQLREVFEMAPELKTKFEAYLSSLPIQQQARVSQVVWKALRGEKEEINELATADTAIMESGPVAGSEPVQESASEEVIMKETIPQNEDMPEEAVPYKEDGTEEIAPSKEGGEEESVHEIDSIDQQLGDVKEEEMEEEPSTIITVITS